MRKYLIGYLGRILCFYLEEENTEKLNKNFNEEKEVKNSLKARKICPFDFDTTINSECLTERSKNFNLNHHNKHKNGCKFTLHKFDTTNSIMKDYSKNNKGYKNANTERSFNELSYNLEKLLLKLQKFFNPFYLKNEDLKFAILKEILECQKLLLIKNMEYNSETKISINEIYDEWKVLAMVIDRICFFFYLFALILSSTVFFVREQVVSQNEN